jgi:hypothetical protein
MYWAEQTSGQIALHFVQYIGKGTVGGKSNGACSLAEWEAAGELP